MKTLTLFLLGAITFNSLSFANEAGIREVEIKTAKIHDAVHWTPEKVEVKAGEKIKLVAKHDLEGGFDFHGLLIPALEIKEQVNRNKPFVKEVTIPSTLKPGEYPIGCQFHPKHVAAKLIVK